MNSLKSLNLIEPNRIVANVVNEVLSAPVKRPKEYVFTVGPKEYVLYPNGDIWLRKKGEAKKLKFSFNGTIWLTQKGRPALVIKDLTKKLKRRLDILAPKANRGTKTKLPKGAKPTPPKTPKVKVDRISSRKKNRPYKEVIKVAQRLVKVLEDLGLTGIVIAGSLRRKEPVVGDIDLMARGRLSLLKNQEKIDIIKGREKSITFMFEGHQVNLYAYKRSYAGGMLLFLTGPGTYNIALRSKAKKMGFKLSQYGLFEGDDNIASRSEKGIFKKLGLVYKEPEFRGKKEKKSKMGVEKISWPKLRKDADNYIKLLDEDQLAEVIRKASKAYYNTGKAIIPDVIFDRVWDRLKKINPKHPQLRQVGAPVERKMGKVKLPFYMGSLNKLKEATADKWFANNPGPYVVSDKMDGISLGIDVEEEIKCYTRGNGYQGQDLSHLVPHLQKYKKIPKKLPRGLQVRCEVEMTEAAFKKYFPKDKNARNTMSGLINQKSIEPALVKRMDVIAYEVIKPALKPSDQFKRLEALGFTVAPWRRVKEVSSDSLSRYLKKRKAKSKHAIDGLVVYVDEKRPRIKGDNPKHARAYKPVSEQQVVQAEIEKVEWQISKHGYLKPVLIIKEVGS